MGRRSVIERRELVVIGAGPAGMRAAMTACAHGVDVMVLDDAVAPGGQIYRAVESPALGDTRTLGGDYARGAELVAGFRRSDVEYQSATTVWEVTCERTVRVSGGLAGRSIAADRVIVATGALERPFPIPGWTLPGVVSAGGAQILLKTAGLVPGRGLVLAGTGPLLILLAWQYVRLGVPIGALLETTRRASRWRALARLPTALASGDFLGKGLGMLRAIRRAGVRHLRAVEDLRAVGEERVERVEFRVAGRAGHVDTSLLLLHQGVVPEVSLLRALGCAYRWDPAQLCFRPRLDEWGNTDIDGVAVAGDGGGIVGALSAERAGELAGLEAACRLRHIDEATRDALARAPRAAYRRSLRVQSFLDTFYRPPDADRVPRAGDVVVCRCEEVRADTVRAEIARGARDPNAIKSRTRCGMGPCQGRFCGLTVTEIIAATREVSPAAAGYFRLRPPAKPVPIGDILAFDTGEAPAEVSLPDPCAHLGTAP